MLLKNVKKFTLLLVIVLVFSAIIMGCGADKPAGETKNSETKKEIVKIGFIGPLTGPNAAQGVGARNAFALAIKQANESGDFPFIIEMVDLDDASQPGTGVSAANMLTSDPKVVVASGHWNSPVALATIPIFKQANIPFLIWGAINPAITTKENYPIVTRVAPTQLQENSPLAKFAIDELGHKKWAIISDTSAYGKDNTEAWKAEIAKRPGAEIVAVEEIQVGQTNFRPILTKLRNMNVDAIYFGGVVMESALVKRQMHEMGMSDIFFGAISGIIDTVFIETAGAEAAEGAIATKPGKPIEKMNGGLEFADAYSKAGYNEPFGAYGPYAYDAANIILAAIKKVGPDPDKLIDAITQTKHSGLLGETTFNEVGQTNNITSTVMVVEDGKWVAWDESKKGK